MRATGWRLILTLVAIGALVGSLAGIAGSAAAPSKKSKSRAGAVERADLPRFHRGLGHGMVLHSEAVVPDDDGSGFETVTMDGGTFKSLDGTTVHLKQAVGDEVYKDDAAIDVGSAAKVYRNGDKAKLGDLKAGDRVRIIQRAGDTVVMAHDEDWRPFGRGHHGRGFGHGPGHGPGGPPAGP